MEPQPGTGLIYENPLFTNVNQLDLTLTQNSPCINAGDPNQFDSDNSIRDIGALIFQSVLPGDCSEDNTVNVLDIIYIINNCIFSEEDICYLCSDFDQNNIINILDIVFLVNIILERN